MKTEWIVFLVLLVFSFSLLATSCIAQKNKNKVLVGKVEDNEIQKLTWFSDGYSEYGPDSSCIKQLSDRQSQYSFILFAGTWCGDTRDLLPKFYKTIDLAGISHEKVSSYFVDREKKSPEGTEKDFKIGAIPVFIIIKDGKEVGRIVESVDESIEKSLIQIIR